MNFKLRYERPGNENISYWLLKIKCLNQVLALYSKKLNRKLAGFRTKVHRKTQFILCMNTNEGYERNVGQFRQKFSVLCINSFRYENTEILSISRHLLIWRTLYQRSLIKYEFIEKSIMKCKLTYCTTGRHFIFFFIMLVHVWYIFADFI